MAELVIPDAWRAALAAVQSVCPKAVIAGGCLRDLTLGREIKDIDIFVSGHGVHELDGLCAKLMRADLDCSPVDTDSLYPVGDGELTGFFEMHFECIDQPVQVIMVDWDTDKICERFDYGICRIAFDGKQIIRHPHFDEDAAACLFRLRRRREGLELVASVHRYARLSRKYEGWKFHHYEDEFVDADGLFDFG